MKLATPLLCAALSLALLAAAGCATLEKAFSEEGVLYKPTARGNYEAGEAALEDKNWEEAVKYYRHTRSKFPYSKYAVLASLRIADAQFGDEKYLEAIDAYRSFIKLHPKHAQVPYARFKIAHAFYERMPEPWFFLPPVEEKDQTQARDARNALRDFLARYPDDANAEQARTLLADAHQRLVDHEVYAAKFYAREGRWQAVVWRSLRVAERFPDSPAAPEALLRAGQAYQELEQAGQAAEVYRALLERYPQSEAATEAQERIRALPAPGADAPASQPASAPAVRAPAPPEPDPQTP